MLRSHLSRFAVDVPLFLLAVVAILTIIQACAGGPGGSSDGYYNYP